jgi:SAM-dependent methyltransferase
MHLILRLSEGRRRALGAARTETLSLLHDFQPELPEGGPFGEIGGLFWLRLGQPCADLRGLLPRLGYAAAAFELTPLSSPPAGVPSSRQTELDLPPAVRWRGAWYRCEERWRRDEEEERAAAPDRRPFLLPTADGLIRTVHGYRGDRRAFPPADARLTVNLSLTPGCARLLDPFAGAGGILLAAKAHALQVLSADIDPFVRFGLAALSGFHAVADARRLPLATGCVDAIASEPPYAPELLGAVIESLPELARVLRPGGRLSLFCSEIQAELLATATQAPLQLRHQFRIDRKGTPCTALVWDRN